MGGTGALLVSLESGNRQGEELTLTYNLGVCVWELRGGVVWKVEIMAPQNISTSEFLEPVNVTPYVARKGHWM